MAPNLEGIDWQFNPGWRQNVLISTEMGTFMALADDDQSGKLNIFHYSCTLQRTKKVTMLAF